MMLVAGQGLSGLGVADALATLPPALLRSAVGSSGGALALALALAGGLRALLRELDGAHEGALVQLLALRGSDARRAALRTWLRGTGRDDPTFAAWPELRILALRCDPPTPTLFCGATTPTARVADALAAAVAWPALCDAVRIDGALYCDVEYAVSPRALLRGLRPRPVLLLEGVSRSLSPLCAGPLRLLCDVAEFHARASAALAPPAAVELALPRAHPLDVLRPPSVALLAHWRATQRAWAGLPLLAALLGARALLVGQAVGAPPQRSSHATADA